VDIRTVIDAWREWKEGIAGQPPVEQLEQDWGPKWRPTSAQRIAFCRRKVILDEVYRLVQTGLSPDDAVAQLEALRNGRSLTKLRKTIQQQKRGSEGQNTDCCPH
jgi:hypothetical protein